MNVTERIAEIDRALSQPGGLAGIALDRLKEHDAKLYEALECAAIPHWWDEGILRNLLDPELASNVDVYMSALTGLPEVEPYLARPGAWNVHETTRRAVRSRLSRGERLSQLSMRAAMAFPVDGREGRIDDLIEHVYHLLIADPEKGAELLNTVHKDWQESGRHLAAESLAAALEDLLPDLSGLGRAAALLVRVEIRVHTRSAVELAKDAREAVRIFEELGRVCGIADALMSLGDAEQAAGRFQASRAAFNQSASIWRNELAAEPSGFRQMRELALALNRLAVLAMVDGRTRDARAHLQESIELSRRLKYLYSERLDSWFGLAMNLADSVNCYVNEGMRAEAEENCVEALDLLRHLVKSDPANTSWLSGLARSLRQRGELAISVGDSDSARSALLESLQICRELVAIDPTQIIWQRGLWVALNRWGRFLMDGGSFQEAEGIASDASAIARRLASLDPDHAAWRRDYGISLLNEGDIQALQDNHDAALSLYKSAWEILEDARRRLPDFSLLRRDAVVAAVKIGVMLIEKSQFNASRQYFVGALKEVRRVCSKDPSNVEPQRDLANVLLKLGDLERFSCKWDAARRCTTEAQRVLRRLTSIDPLRTEWQHDLAHSIFKHSQLDMMLGMRAAARGKLKETLEILTRVVEHDPRNLRYNSFLNFVLQKGQEWSL